MTIRRKPQPLSDGEVLTGCSIVGCGLISVSFIFWFMMAFIVKQVLL